MMRMMDEIHGDVYETPRFFILFLVLPLLKKDNEVLQGESRIFVSCRFGESSLKWKSDCFRLSLKKADFVLIVSMMGNVYSCLRGDGTQFRFEKGTTELRV